VLTRLLILPARLLLWLEGPPADAAACTCPEWHDPAASVTAEPLGHLVLLTLGRGDGPHESVARTPAQVRALAERLVVLADLAERHAAMLRRKAVR
jgi:hypothetical protein